MRLPGFLLGLFHRHVTASVAPLPWRLILWPAVWVGLVLNLPTWLRRLDEFWQPLAPPLRWLGATGELALVGGLSVLLFALAGLLGHRWLRVLGAMLLLISAACAYYMTRFNVVIGYGVIGAILTTDHDMSAEVVGLGTLVWLLVAGLAPAALLWRSLNTSGWARSNPAQRWLALWPVLLAAGLVLSSGQAALSHVRKAARASTADVDRNLVGIAAHAYVPSNWVAGTGMMLGAEGTRWWRGHQLVAPAQKFTYRSGPHLQDAIVLLVIGETTRSDRMSVLGHARDTTPHLRRDPDVVALRGKSCNTSTKLSLACMFVRPEGMSRSKGSAPDVIHEDGVFSVLRHLGFQIELFAMQSEAGFYSRVQPHSYKIREVIAAEPQNAGKRQDDLLLVDQLDRALRQPAGRPRLLILHTKGSHYLYSQRHTREFARWQPECLSTDQACSAQELFNSFDNSILFVDHTLHEMRRRLAPHKALMVFVSDHGESIAANTHFHATPRHLAPPEQFRVPLIFWASERWRADPELDRRYTQLRQRASAESATPLDQEQVGHHNLFDTLLGCAGIDSPDGGINPRLNLCSPR